MEQTPTCWFPFSNALFAEENEHNLRVKRINRAKSGDDNVNRDQRPVQRPPSIFIQGEIEHVKATVKLKRRCYFCSLNVRLERKRFDASE